MNKLEKIQQNKAKAQAKLIKLEADEKQELMKLKMTIGEKYIRNQKISSPNESLESLVESLDSEYAQLNSRVQKNDVQPVIKNDLQERTEESE